MLCSLLYPDHQTTYFMSGACQVRRIFFSTTNSLSLTASSSSFFLRGIGTLFWFALLGSWSGSCGGEDGTYATRSIDTYCGLPMSSIVTVFFGTIIFCYGVLVCA